MPRRPDPVDPSASPWHLLGATMRYWREEVRHLSQREAAAKALCDDGDLSKWERGRAHPQADTVARLDALYGTGGQLVALHATVDELDRLRRGNLETTAPAHDVDGDMHRRAAMRLIAAISAGAAIPAGTLETLFSGVEHAVAGREGMSVDDWEEVVWEYGHLWLTRPAGSLVSGVTTDYAEVSRLLGQNQTPIMRDGLLRVSAQLATVLAIELSDVGEHDNSLRTWRMARRSADATGDRDLRVWVRAREALYAFWSDRPLSVAARLADDAVRIGEGTLSGGLIRAYSAKALISAAQGDTELARTTQHDLSRVFDRLPGTVTDDHASPIWRYSERALRWDQACASAFAGDTRGAFQATERALALFPADYHGDIANLRLVHALALVQDQDVTEGLDSGLEVTRQRPPSAIRRRLTSQIIKALPEKARALDTASELRALTSS